MFTIVIVCIIVLAIIIFAGVGAITHFLPSMILGFAAVAAYRVLIAKQPVIQKGGIVKFAIMCLIVGICVNYVLRYIGINFG